MTYEEKVLKELMIFGNDRNWDWDGQPEKLESFISSALKKQREEIVACLPPDDEDTYRFVEEFLDNIKHKGL